MPASEAEALTPAVNPAVTDTVAALPQVTVLSGLKQKTPKA
jgi:hypothetical protein